jgi:hypothetical protein
LSRANRPLAKLNFIVMASLLVWVSFQKDDLSITDGRIIDITETNETGVYLI